MLNLNDIFETINMIRQENLDIRTITMGISLLDCADSNIDVSCEKVYNKIYNHAKDLVATGEYLEKKYGIPIVNKRISVGKEGKYNGLKRTSNQYFYFADNIDLHDEFPVSQHLK